MSNLPRFALSEICENITDGSHFSPKLTNDGYPYITVRDIVEDSINFADCKYVNEQDYRQLAGNGCKPSKGDVLFSKDGTVGKVALVDTSREFVVLSSLAILRPNQSRVFPPYLKYALKSPEFLKVALGKKTGAAIRRIILRNLKSIEIPLPTLAEQKRIVALLDEAFAGIDEAKAKAVDGLRLAHDSFKAQLQSTFTKRGPNWVDRTLEEASTTFGRGKSKHRPRNAPHLYGGKYPFVQTGDIRSANHTITEYSQTYSDAGLAQSKLWPKGTICITIAANIAETAILDFDACFPDSVIGVVADPKIADIGYIEYVLQSLKARLQSMGKGSAQANINMGTFENERFPFPPVAEQRKMVSLLDTLSTHAHELASLYEAKEAAFSELKNSLLAQAFAGELTA